MAKQHFLDLFFNPRNVAVVGASRNPLTLNFNLVGNLVKLGFSGEIYPVNPNADEILGIGAYASLKDIEGDIDLVVSAVPAHMTLDIVKECVEKKVKGVVLVSGGFSEIGEQGSKMQDEIAYLLKQNGIRAIGPNALSPINSLNNLVVSFHLVEKLRRGSLSFIFQSGMYEPRLDWILSDFHLGISKLIDLGNKMDISEVDALEYLAQDLDTKVIAIHLENVKGDGRKFMQLLRNTSRKKPIVVLKSGRTAAGAKAAASHTGSLAEGNDAIFNTVLKQAGGIRAQSLEDFFDFAKAFEFLGLPRNNRIVVATLPGGEGVIAADICQQEGFSMAKPSQRTFDKVKAVFPPWEIPLNPFDLGVCLQFHQFNEVYNIFLESMLDDENVDCLAVGLPPFGPLLGPEEAHKSFLSGKEKGKPIVLWPHAMSKSLDALVEKLELNGVPVYPSAERAIKA
ncbi:MAG: CoA-binding protein, partial [Dehalococcoidia bacterium]|nr:CoA-binding protein [Dehalococcoidia bacterium]